MKGEIVDITRMRTAKIQEEKEVEQLSKRLEELRKKKYFIDKEIELIEFLLSSAKERNDFSVEKLCKLISELEIIDNNE
jgi:hypothetical protein